MPKRTNAEEIEKLSKILPPAKEEMRGQSSVDPTLLRRVRPAKVEDSKPEPPPLTSGAIDKIVDLALNPSRETIRGFTNIDRIQGKLLPQLDIIDLVWQYIIEIAAYRQDAVEYTRVYKYKRPVPPNLIDTFTYRPAPWGEVG